MNREEFIDAYYNIAKRAVTFSKKAIKEGILPLEDDLIREKIEKRDIFEYGMQFVVDGHDRAFIDKLLTNIINHEQDEYSRLLKTMQKEAVLLIWGGTNPVALSAFLNSYTDLSLTEDKILYR